MNTTLGFPITNWYRSLKVRDKFLLAFGLIFLLIFAVAAIVITRLNEGLYEFEYFLENEARLTQLGNDIRYYDSALTESFVSYLIDPQNAAAYDNYFENAAALDAAIAEGREIGGLTHTEDVEFFENVEAINRELVEIETELLANPSIEAGREALLGSYSALKAEFDELLDEFFEEQTEEYAYAAERIPQDLQNSIAVLVGGMVLLGISTMGSALVLTRYVTKRLNTLKHATGAFAGGDLKARAEIMSADELGELAVSFNEMAAHEQESIRRLEAARRQAENATRMKDLFLATMSHELRTPLNAMIGFLHLMIFSGQLNEDNEYMAQRSLVNTQRLLNLINNILDLSRISTGGLEIVPSSIALRHLASGLYNDLKVLAAEKHLQFDLNLDPQLPDTINHDETRIAQIVTNLVGNAIKFTEAGTIALHFKRSDDRLVIQVTDTGVGIPESKQQLIFDDFFQVDAASNRKHQGAGLGLAIVKRLVLLMKGNLAVNSQVGVGSTFTIDLPINLPNYEPHQQHPATVAAALSTEPRSALIPA